MYTSVYNVDQFADTVNTWVNSDFKNKYKPETIAKINEILELAKYLAWLAKDIEWLYFEDITEDSFMKRIQKIEELYQKNFFKSSDME